MLRQKIHFIFITITINITTFTSNVLCEQSIRSTLIMEGCDCKVTYLLYCTHSKFVKSFLGQGMLIYFSTSFSRRAAVGVK